MTDGESAALAVAFNGMGASGIGEVDLEIDAAGDLLQIDPAGDVLQAAPGITFDGMSAAAGV